VTVDSGTFGRDTWTGAASLGSLTVNAGGTIVGNDNVWTITSETGGGYAAYLLNSTITGTVNLTVTTPATTFVNLNASSGTINDFILNNDASTTLCLIVGGATIGGDLTATQGNVEGNSTTANLTVTGDVLVDANGRFGKADRTGGIINLGSLTVNAGGGILSDGQTLDHY